MNGCSDCTYNIDNMCEKPSIVENRGGKCSGFLAIKDELVCEFDKEVSGAMNR